MTTPMMQVLDDCENLLGWRPPMGEARFKARAGMHRRLHAAMNAARLTVGDLQLSVQYCRKRRHPIDSPMELIALAAKAKELSAHEIDLPDLLATQQEAIAWEMAFPDNRTAGWVFRLQRASGEGLSETLQEWALDGRGWPR